jgi:hypothetical protein
MKGHRMTTHEFDAATSSPRPTLAAAETPSVPSPSRAQSDSASHLFTEFNATIANVTDEQHQNMAGLVQPADFNADVVVRFLRDNGIDAHVDRSTGGFRFALADPAREEHVRFACVCLRASISYAIEAAYWCMEAKR